MEKKEVAPKPAAPALVKPVTARPLQGAWGARAAAAVAPPASAPEPVPAAEPVVEEAPFIVEETPEPVLEEPTVDVGVVSAQDPTPSGIITEDVAPPAPKPIAATGGNVWGTKGGAHLIQAEKKPVIPETPPAPVVEFTLNPSGSSSSSSSSSGWGGIKAQFSFFGKLVTYFVALRLVHVYWGDSPPKAIDN